MEHFVQTNMFARVRAVFARIRTVFAHLIIGCAIRYPKIGCLCYTNDSVFPKNDMWEMNDHHVRYIISPNINIHLTIIDRYNHGILKCLTFGQQLW